MGLSYIADCLPPCSGGSFFKTGAKSWIKRATYKEIGEKLGKNATKKFVKAMYNGIVGSSNQQGIKILNATVGGKLYKYELKILGDFGGWRLVGNLDSKNLSKPK